MTSSIILETLCFVFCRGFSSCVVSEPSMANQEHRAKPSASFSHSFEEKIIANTK